MTNDRARRLHALFTPVVHSCGHNRWCPAADVYRTADGWLVKVELAGVRPGVRPGSRSPRAGGD